jgi:hypothetical protein
MTHLEKLTLYLRLRKRSAFVDGTDVYNEILVRMPQLHTFIFYISTQTVIRNLAYRKFYNEIEQTLTNIKYGQTACTIDDSNTVQAICHIYSVPFTFIRLEKISNQFPTILFGTVTYLYTFDKVPVQHEFFMRSSQDCPLLKHFSMVNPTSQAWESDENPFYSVIEYPHMDYIAQFLLETKAHLPCLSKLDVNYSQLKTITMNFTRDATRRNCSRVKQLNDEESKIFSKDVYRYFLSLYSQS